LDNFAASLTKKVLFDRLTAGVKYTLQLCSIGGSTGKSD
jgi:hypothetical protein